MINFYLRMMIKTILIIYGITLLSSAFLLNAQTIQPERQNQIEQLMRAAATGNNEKVKLLLENTHDIINQLSNHTGYPEICRTLVWLSLRFLDDERIIVSKVYFFLDMLKVRHVLPLQQHFQMAILLGFWMGALPGIIYDTHRVRTRPEVNLG